MDAILLAYCNWSGQKINKHKSSIFFNPNTLPEVVVAISSTLQLSKMKNDSKYLGLPLFWGKPNPNILL